MNHEENMKFLIKAMNIQKDNVEVFEEQNKLSMICKEKAKAFYDLEDKLYELYSVGTKKFTEMYPNLLNTIDGTKYEQLIHNVSTYINQTDEIKMIIQKMNEIPELKEAGELEKERSIKFYEYAMAHLKLDNNINENKKKLFTKEYLDKMDEYADKGVMLYYLETPDAPILDSEVTPQLLLESLIYDNYTSLYTLYYSYINCPEPGISMQRKIEDVKDVFANLVNGCYRTAARTMFALMDSEIKNISTCLERFFEKEKKYKNGKQRSEKIDEITKYMDMPNAVNQWKKINSYYEKILTGKDSLIDRNKIIHGDYNDSALDLDEYDIVKLLLLYLSIRMHGDYIQNHVMLYENALTYVFTTFASKLKNSKK